MGKIYCSKCGVQIDDSSTYCYKCGNAINVLSESAERNPSSSVTYKKRNPFVKWIFISIIVQIVLVILSARPGDLGGLAFGSALALTLAVLTFSILTIIKSNKKQVGGKTVGIIFTTLSSLLILVVVMSVIFFSGDNNSENNNDTVAPRNDEIITETSQNETVNTPTISATDWDSFECEYYGDLPIGLLCTPDATSDIVQKYINDRLGTNSTYEVRQIYNAYHSSLMEVDDVFELYNCKGKVTFYFDWNYTLFQIDFEFDDENITPAIMETVHNDIDKLVGGKCSTNYLIDKGGTGEHSKISENSSCFCGWHLQDDLVYKANFCSYFSSGRSIDNSFKFERIKYTNKTNYSATANRADGSDKITTNGVTISGKYHNLSNPYISGTATNNSSQTVKFIKIKIALKDSSGKVVDTVWTYAVGAEGLLPGESTQWKVYCDNTKNIKDITISIFN